MYCKYCGRQISGSAVFCPYCGKNLVSPDGSYAGQGDKKKKRRQRRSKWPWFLAGFIVLLLMIAAAYLWHSLRRNIAGDPEQINANVQVVEDDIYDLDVNTIETDENTGISFVNNIVIIFFQPGVTKEQVNATVDSIGGEIVGSLDFIDQYQVRVAKHSLAELKQICDELEEREEVLFAQYDAAIKLADNAVPDDPWTGSLWSPHKWSEDSPGGSNWWLEAIEAPSAWEYNSYFSKIKIGVVDNGFDTGHEDLKNVITSVSAWNSKEEHGTHVAGIIGAEANNKKGITGVVWNCEIATKDWKLENKKDPEYNNWSATSHIVGYTALLIQEGCKVVNLSAGATMSEKDTSFSKESIDELAHYTSAYLFALLFRKYDFVIVQAAGNGNEAHVSVDAINNGYFCSIDRTNCVTGEKIIADDIIDRIIVVGAARNGKNKHYVQCSFSNAGSRVDICAPGEGIYSTIPGGISGKYEYLPGTSMAAPMVAGVAALVWSVCPSLHGDQVKKIVCKRENTKYDVADNTSKKHPLVNTYRMVNAKLAVEDAIDYSKTWKAIKDPDSSLKPYLTVIDKLASQYGELQIKQKEDNCHEAYGLCFLKLLDFTGDGIDELMCVCKKENEEHYHGFIYTVEHRKTRLIYETDHIEYSPDVNCYDVIYTSYTDDTGYIFGTGWEDADGDDRTFYYYDGEKISPVYRSHGYWDNTKNAAVMYEDEKVVNLFDDQHRDQMWGNASLITLRTFYKDYDINNYDEEALRTTITEVKNRLLSEN